MATDDEKPRFDFSDPNIITVYANDTAAIVGDSEINLYFSDSSPTSQDSTQKRLNTRVVLSHSTFVHMMDFWMARYEFIRAIYGGTPGSIMDLRLNEPDKYEEAIQKYLGGLNSREETQQEETTQDE